MSDPTFEPIKNLEPRMKMLVTRLMEAMLNLGPEFEAAEVFFKCEPEDESAAWMLDLEGKSYVVHVYETGLMGPK